MPVVRSISLAAAASVAFGLLVFAASAGAVAPKNCGSVGVTIPHTGGHGHAALNNLTAANVACSTARSAATTFLLKGKAPKNWGATSKTVVVHARGQTNTVSEEILTHGDARVIGDVAN
jgi:hypothetical protein